MRLSTSRVRRRLAVVLAALLLSTVSSGALDPSSATAKEHPAKAHPAKEHPAKGNGDGDAWVLSTTDPSTDYTPTFLGNGYFSTRVPAEGAGFSASPLLTESQLAGFYGQGPGISVQRVNLPAWSTLGISDGSATYGNVASAAACEFDTVCEAETGKLTGGAFTATNHKDYGGSGFVAGYGPGGKPAPDASAAVTIGHAPAGTARLTVRYAAGGTTAQTLSAQVNGAAPVRLQLPVTSSWDAWGTATLDVPVTAGTNTVAVTCAQGDSCLANVDAISLSAVDTPPAAKAPVGTTSHYKQSLDMRRGTITTSLTWTSPAGRATRLTYRVIVDRANAHLGVTHVDITPLNWSGPLSVIDMLDGRADTLPANHRLAKPVDLTKVSSGRVDRSSASISESLTTQQIGMRAGLASVLRVDGRRVATEPYTDVPANSLAQRAGLHVRAGRTYEATKFVGIASSNDTAQGSAPLVTDGPADPQAAALGYATHAARQGLRPIETAHERAWARLWQSDITVLGDTELTQRLRAGTFYLLSSVRDGVDWGLSPGGMSSADYNGHVFWDADTWMNPALLAAHPDLARGLLDYRSTLLDAARANAQAHGYQGAQYPWESADTGNDVGIHPREIHIDSDVALGQWQYYEATGDLEWLRTEGWPVIKSVARFWASRVTPDGHGGYDLADVQSPDENHDHETNSAYTNAGAITVLGIATEAARLVGEQPDPRWAQVAGGLTVAVDPATGVHPEYDGYNGSTINQADTVMLQYPLNYPMTDAQAQADLDYYTPRTDINGPSMTDSINLIDSARLGTPGCVTETFLKRSLDPYTYAPFDQFAEKREGGAFTFTTGIGGVLQAFTYGFTGLRLGSDAVTVDPMLPPGIPGIDLTGLHWHGNTFDVSIRHDGTRVTLRSGHTLVVSAAGRRTKPHGHHSVTVTTRRPDLAPTQDAARCKTVSASTADPSFPAVAAVDGSPSTRWKATGPGASLTVDLGRATTVGRTKVTAYGATTAYRIDVSADGRTWTPFGAPVAATAASGTMVTAPPVRARYVRYTAVGTATPQVVAMEVYRGAGG
ncbi:discoidin domain-containing protein [Streptomyces montanisoli]|uniref:Discoidin domain-containing protein n=1 Tax=Streptomyces montanisoli TaxID=2798581 RepID=A0A940MG09_9ACTN|nr:discoidin domain-containing protein [Streptomyces montanisoli]MBP0460549.1 discoidin domain-containing protein [Streptomyces montanisoli]